MEWEGDERRRRITNPTQHHRRHDDLRQAFSELDDLREEIGDLKDELIALKNLPMAIGTLDGKVDVLTELCQRIDGKTGFNWTAFLATVIVPLVGVLLTAYIALRLGAPQALPGGTR